MFKKQLKQNEEIAKIIERDQIISYKKKPSSKPQKEDDDQIQSANSLKSGVFSEDSQVRNSKKNTPLPELYRDNKKRMFHKNFVIGEVKQVNNYLQKQVRQHDNLVLKQKNNLLTTQNMKLKTKVMTLQKQIVRISKNIEEEVQKPKQPGLMPKDNRFKGSQTLSLKMAIKNLRKQLDEQKKQNEKIKWSIKFTRINELQCQRDQILNETIRLRQIIDQQQLKKASLKTKQLGLSNLQQRFQSLNQKNLTLSKQNAELNKKIKSFEEGNRKFKQVSQNEKNLSKMLFNAKRLIKEKQKQIQSLKSGTQVKIESIASINNDPKSNKQVGSKPIVEVNKSKEKRIMSKSAQKYRKKISDEGQDIGGECINCHKHKQKIAQLEKKIDHLQGLLKAQKQNSAKFGNMGQFSREQIDLPSNEEAEKLARFLVFRFKAHHLTIQQAQKYLINGQLTQAVKKQQISVLQMSESLIAEPFSVISSRYLEVCLIKLFYQQEIQKGKYKPNQKIKIDENKKLTKGDILTNFLKMVKSYDIMSQEKEEQMFIQIAQLVTNYHQHILTALNRKRNGEGTISEQELINFFNEIQLEKEFVDFIICQIILESLDLEHLNYYTMFEIFYMPSQQQQQGQTHNQPNQPNKKKFQVDHSQVVKEQDQEYEESKSHIDTKQKTQSKKQQQQQYYQEEQDFQKNSPSQHSQKQKPQDDESLQNVKVEARQKRNQSLKNVEAKLEKQKIKQIAKERERAKELEKSFEKKQEKQKLKSKPQIQVQQENYQNYEQQFEEEKMDQLPEEEKANENDEHQQEQLKPYAMEEAIGDEYQQEEED